MKTRLLVSALLINLFGFALPQSPALAKSGMIQVKGSDTMVNLVQAWAEEYMNGQPNTFIAVTGGGSGTGFAALINGTCDIAMSSRNITPKEITLARSKGTDPKERVVALDGLAVVVHKNNPVSELTLDQIAGIFTGKIKNWQEVGGRSEEIVILSREVNSGTHVYFKEHVLRRGDSKSTEEFSPKSLLLPSSQAIADEVAQNSKAIGYYGMGYISSNQKALSVRKDANAASAAPTIDNILGGSYPISRPLFIYTKGGPIGDVRAFLDFIVSKKGQEIVSQMDFVPTQKS